MFYRYLDIDSSPISIIPFLRLHRHEPLRGGEIERWYRDGYGAESLDRETSEYTRSRMIV